VLVYVDLLRKKHWPWVYEVEWGKAQAPSPGTGKAYQITCHACAELIHASTLLQVPKPGAYTVHI